jgi:hypothetical protein
VRRLVAAAALAAVLTACGVKAQREPEIVRSPPPPPTATPTATEQPTHSPTPTPTAPD